MNKKSNQQHNTNKQSSAFNAIAMASSAGFTLLGCLAGFAWIGWKIDSWLDTSPAGLFIGGILGGAGGFYLLYKQVSKY